MRTLLNHRVSIKKDNLVTDFGCRVICRCSLGTFLFYNSQAGLSYTPDTITLALLKDQDALGKVLARAPPQWTPGTAKGYHAMTFGLYVSQLLRRVDPKQRTLGQFFKEEIALPFGNI